MLLMCLNCETRLNRHQTKYCSNDCQRQYENKMKVESWLAGKTSGSHIYGVSYPIKRYLREQCGNACTLCGWSKVNPTTGVVPLEVDHIDGDWNNGSKENLRLICPNCHSLSPNFRALNKGKGRHTTLKSKGKAVFGS